jgi:hypothetical protein
MEYEHESETAERNSKEKAERVEFTPPKEFVMPEGTEANGEFDLVCTFKVNGGKLCMTMLGDHKMPGYGKNDETQKSTPDIKGYVNDMFGAIGATNPQSY